MSENKCPVTNYGGQAVVEGVMMRGKKFFAVSCRKRSGEIVSTCENVENNLGCFAGLIKIPFLRGIVALADSMILGTKTLMYSADIAIADEEENKQKNEALSEKDIKKQKKQQKEAERAKNELKKSDNKVNGIFVGLSAFVGVAIGVCLFMLIPIIITKFVTGTMPFLKDNWVLFALIEGILKFLIFVGYVWLISFMPDVKRVFSYHGAEHKTINCYEGEEELTVENVRKYTTINPRCGTSFLLIFISISIILFCFVPTPEVLGKIFVSNAVFVAKIGILVRFALKIILLPIIAGIAYECIKFSAKKPNSIFTKTIMAPGLLMQKLTTKEPDDSMIECAINSLKLVIDKENNDKAEENS
ncbi:MAG: DUF1385 domain-containing protein [Armatimonadetes bacterium]|nr:DUF1385 domain-containing protein [Candidatus Hippobium faecium]